MDIIKIKDLCFNYQGKDPLFKNLNLNIKKGSFNVILGGNGSGKSTLVKLLLGLVNATSGEIIIDDLVLSNSNVYEIRKKLGVVFQNPDNQFIGSTVRDDIAFGLENRCVDQSLMDSIIDEYSKKVKMEEYLDKEPTNLSGGQKQRVAIAGILAMKPKIIIFDEATSMLDPEGRNEINSLIKEIRNSDPNVTIVLVTHIMDEALNADNIIILNKGEIVMEGKPKEVFSSLEIIDKYNLDIPFLFKMKIELSKFGIEIEDIDEDMMVEKLCQ